MMIDVYKRQVVIFGVEKGIEKASRIMMPILAILAVVIAIRCV